MNLLIVDDDKEIINFLKPSLKAEGFVVDTADDGENGLYKAQINNYDLIVLDNVLPKKTGLEVCTEIRKERKSVPILILSATTATDVKTGFLNSGADDYVVKPFCFSELSARIKALLRRPKSIEHTVLRVDNLALDTESHTVMLGKKEINLTMKEFSLLEYFMKNKNRVLSRGEILEHVWGSDADIFTNTIETHILNLRRKIGQNNKNEFICTIPGMGYKLILP
jgi:DNA-binding response OmpR family regulator